MHTAQSMLRRFLGSTQAGPQLSIFRKMKRKLPAPLRAGAGRIGRSLGTAYRAVLLRRVTFIGVTGSVGKTTTKEIISAILARQFTGSKSEGNDNVLMYNTTFRVRPWHKYCVQEIAAAVGSQKIPLERSLALVRPGIGVVTSIGTDHLSVFGSMEAIAAEKGKLIEALPDTGAAILNADDPLVLAMSLRCRGKIVTYGLAADAQVRAEGIRSSWPDRLTFDVIHGDQRHTVRTQLCGTHWVPCVLAAIATSLEMGVPLAAAAHAIETVPPAKRRMEPVIRADGITFIRDDIKAPLQSIPPALDFIRNAQASRRIVVIGTISDYAGNSTRRYNQVARQALDVADLVLFVGPKASKCLKSKNHPKGEALLMFNSAALAAEYLSDILNPGDLVLLKGSEHADNLEAILSAQRRDWQSLELDGLGALPRERATPLHVTWSRPAEQRRVATRVAEPGSVRLVAGLGNPGEKYRDTPHNVGHRVLDRLASTLEGSWEPRGETAVASVEWKGTTVYLTKLVTNINNSGPVLEKLCRELAFGPADCVLVHDDVDLPLGTVRVRMRGSDGGHRGVRSVFEVFGTDSIARVKVGVGRPGRSSEVASHVLRPFLPEELAAVEASLDRAVADVLELLPADDVGLCRSRDAGPLWPPGLPEQSENLERTASR